MRVARIIGKDEDARRLKQMLDQVKTAFAHEFVAPSGRLTYDDQTSYAPALLHGLVPEGRKDAAINYFKTAIHRTGGRLGTGFIGTPALLPALDSVGEGALAGEVFLREEVPGWLYRVKRGATTIWERWDAVQEDGTIYNPQMNSFNHYAFGAVCQWLLESVAGFRPDEAEHGFKSIIFSPTIIDGLSPVSAEYASKNGVVRATWSVDGDAVRYHFTVPEGARGRLKLSQDYSDVTMNGVSLLPGIEHAVGPGRAPGFVQL
ncbi:hypothetical protein N8D56_25270 (plasmid) [Devosia sp. A8/3-2]|nr:hypothetical protein N8D56_25270 [Devosia sp. A8/3-2]